MKIGDKFILIDHIEIEDLRLIHYSSRDINSIFDHLDDGNLYTITRIVVKPNDNLTQIYYINPSVGGECYFCKWMVLIVESAAPAGPRGHVLTKMFRN